MCVRMLHFTNSSHSVLLLDDGKYKMSLLVKSDLSGHSLLSEPSKLSCVVVCHIGYNPSLFSALIVCVYEEPVVPEQAATVTEKLGEYLISVGY